MSPGFLGRVMNVGGNLPCSGRAGHLGPRQL
jgi:hypothetical protein